MARTLVVVLVCIVALGACTQRLVCPAYQSAFIYDQESLRKKFSYFVDDSTPKVFTASKSKYLIAEPVSYQKKVRSLQTVQMIPVYPIVPDSLRDGYQASLAELDSAARSVIDSTYIVDVDQQEDTLQQVGGDSVYVISKDKEVRLLKYDLDSLKYSVVEVRLNVDQDNYMWYLRDNLILPDVRLAKLQSEGKGEKVKKGFLGFFKNIFKKKKKAPLDTSAVTKKIVKGENDFDYIDTVEQTKPIIAKPEQPKKKGFFSFLKKKKKNNAQGDGANAISPSEDKSIQKKKSKKKKTSPPIEESIAEPDKKQDDQKGDGF